MRRRKMIAAVVGLIAVIVGLCLTVPGLLQPLVQESSREGDLESTAEPARDVEPTYGSEAMNETEGRAQDLTDAPGLVTTESPVTVDVDVGASDSDSAEVRRLVDEFKRSKRDWWQEQLGRGATDESELKQVAALFSLDERMRHLVDVAFQRAGRFDVLRRALEGTIEFRAMPEGYISEPDVREAIQHAQMLPRDSLETPRSSSTRA